MQEETLNEIKERLDAAKNLKAQKEGVVKAEMETLKKEYGVNSLDEAYALLDKKKSQLAVKQEEKEELKKEAAERLDKIRGIK